MCAKPVTSVVPYNALNSSNSEPSTSRAITSRTSYCFFRSAGTMPSSSQASYLRFRRRGERDVDVFSGVQGADDTSAQRKGMAVVLGVIIGHAGFPRMHVGATEVLRRNHLAGGRLHQRRAAEKNSALVAHDDGFVRHRRHVSAARRA